MKRDSVPSSSSSSHHFARGSGASYVRTTHHAQHSQTAHRRARDSQPPTSSSNLSSPLRPSAKSPSKGPSHRASGQHQQHQRKAAESVTRGPLVGLNCAVKANGVGAHPLEDPLRDCLLEYLMSVGPVEGGGDETVVYQLSKEMEMRNGECRRELRLSSFQLRLPQPLFSKLWDAVKNEDSSLPHILKVAKQITAPPPPPEDPVMAQITMQEALQTRLEVARWMLGCVEPASEALLDYGTLRALSNQIHQCVQATDEAANALSPITQATDRTPLPPPDPFRSTPSFRRPADTHPHRGRRLSHSTIPTNLAHMASPAFSRKAGGGSGSGSLSSELNALDELLYSSPDRRRGSDEHEHQSDDGDCLRSLDVRGYSGLGGVIAGLRSVNITDEAGAPPSGPRRTFSSPLGDVTRSDDTPMMRRLESDGGLGGWRNNRRDATEHQRASATLWRAFLSERPTQIRERCSSVAQKLAEDATANAARQRALRRDSVGSLPSEPPPADHPDPSSPPVTVKAFASLANALALVGLKSFRVAGALSGSLLGLGRELMDRMVCRGITRVLDWHVGMDDPLSGDFMRTLPKVRIRNPTTLALVEKFNDVLQERVSSCSPDQIDAVHQLLHRLLANVERRDAQLHSKNKDKDKKDTTDGNKKNSDNGPSAAAASNSDDDPFSAFLKARGPPHPAHSTKSKMQKKRKKKKHAANGAGAKKAVLHEVPPVLTSIKTPESAHSGARIRPGTLDRDDSDDDILLDDFDPSNTLTRAKAALRSRRLELSKSREKERERERSKGETEGSGAGGSGRSSREGERGTSTTTTGRFTVYPMRREHMTPDGNRMSRSSMGGADGGLLSSPSTTTSGRFGSTDPLFKVSAAAGDTPSRPLRRSPLHYAPEETHPQPSQPSRPHLSSRFASVSSGTPATDNAAGDLGDDFVYGSGSRGSGGNGSSKRGAGLRIDDDDDVLIEDGGLSDDDDDLAGGGLFGGTDEEGEGWGEEETDDEESESDDESQDEDEEEEENEEDIDFAERLEKALNGLSAQGLKHLASIASAFLTFCERVADGISTEYKNLDFEVALAFFGLEFLPRSKKDLRKRYLELSLKLHPDKNPNSTAEDFQMLQKYKEQLENEIGKKGSRVEDEADSPSVGLTRLNEHLSRCAESMAQGYVFDLHKDKAMLKAFLNMTKNSSNPKDVLFMLLLTTRMECMLDQLTGPEGDTTEKPDDPDAAAADKDKDSKDGQDDEHKDDNDKSKDADDEDNESKAKEGDPSEPPPAASASAADDDRDDAGREDDSDAPRQRQKVPVTTREKVVHALQASLPTCLNSIHSVQQKLVERHIEIAQSKAKWHLRTSRKQLEDLLGQVVTAIQTKVLNDPPSLQTSMRHRCRVVWLALDLLPPEMTSLLHLHALNELPQTSAVLRHRLIDPLTNIAERGATSASVSSSRGGHIVTLHDTDEGRRLRHRLEGIITDLDHTVRAAEMQAIATATGPGAAAAEAAGGANDATPARPSAHRGYAGKRERE
ncbi:unnamed protein product [Vitrella brassicaformis CCMP3155]|uniref:J domain-containing protein n=3 Tax=Vitrella brassicaformis TaxID=1169539 RepID=A0A0G4EU14_VITBC|nr:unnamed protein product [Vitrella brassicaformis CCMP3155]|eukprot:CEM01563.1 unnamed protein product [Vitrella brassicaformis CCMP3155]